MAEQIPLSDKKSKWEEERRKKAIAEATDAEVVTDVDAEKNLGIEVGNGFPTSGILAEMRKNEKKEDMLIDRNIAAERAAEKKGVPSAMAQAFANPKPLKEWKKNGNENGKNASKVETGEAKIIPPELENIFGKEVPSDVLEMYGKLKGKKKRESYIKKLRIEDAERRKKEIAQATPASDALEKTRKIERNTGPSLIERATEAGEEILKTRRAARTSRVEPPPEDEALLDLFKARKDRGEILPQGMQRRKRGPEKIVPNPAEAIDQEHVYEVLGKSEVEAERSKLRELVGKLIGGAREIKEELKGKGFAESMGYLGGRVKELDAALAPMAEKFVEKMGEAYNKSPLWQKITLGVALTVGYGFTLPVSTVGAGLFGGAIAFQRAYGLAGTFRNFEKKFEAANKREATGMLANTRLYKWLASGPESSRKEKAMAGAVIYSIGLAGAMSLAAHEFASHHVGERIGEWLRSHMPGGETGAAAVSAGSSEAIPTAASAPTREMPPVQDFGMDADQVEEAVSATPAEPEAFVIQPTAEMSPVQGLDIESASEAPLAQEIIKTPEPIQPIDLTQAQDLANQQVVEAPAVPEAGHLVDSKGHHVSYSQGNEIRTGSYEQQPLAPVEEATITPVASAEAPVPEVAPSAQEVSAFVEAPLTQETIVTPEPIPTVEAPEYPLKTAPLAPEAVPTSAVEQTGIISNQFGLQIPTAEPHIYAGSGAKELFVYGGSPQERAKTMLDYLLKNPNKIIYAPGEHDQRIPWRIIKGVLVPDKPATEGWLFNRVLLKAPIPDDLKELVQ